MPITSNLQKIMENREVSYEELQFLSKTAPDTIARARDHRIASCQLKTLEKIALALGVSIHELFDHSPDCKAYKSKQL